MFQRCSGFRRTAYCGRACQLARWRVRIPQLRGEHRPFRVVNCAFEDYFLAATVELS